MRNSKPNRKRGRPKGKLDLPEVIATDIRFTYLHWEQHAQKVEQTLTSTAFATISHTPKEAAQMMLKGMERFQHIHDGTLKHSTIQKLQVAEFTYPQWRRDVQEALECYLRMEDSLAKAIVADIVKKQKMHNGHSPHNVIALLDLASRDSSKQFFTYDGWEKHIQVIRDTLANKYNQVELSFGPSRDEVAEDMFNGMKRFQAVHTKQKHHNSIKLLLQNTVSFTYPNWVKDKHEAMMDFLKFEDQEAEELLDVMNLKQDMFKGNRSNNVLVELDSSSFSYDGWQNHADAVEMSLTSTFKSNFGETRKTTAKKLLKGMHRIQLVFKKKQRHRGISRLYGNNNFSYPRWEKDRIEAMHYYLRFEDEYAKEAINLMIKKQKIHDGDRSEDILVALDKMRLDFDASVTSENIMDSDSEEYHHGDNEESPSSNSPRDVIDGFDKDQRRIAAVTYAKSARDSMRRIERQRNSSAQSTGNISTGSSISSARENRRRIENRYSRFQRQDEIVHT